MWGGGVQTRVQVFTVPQRALGPLKLGLQAAMSCLTWELRSVIAVHIPNH